jgi:hypothetical protein
MGSTNRVIGHIQEISVSSVATQFLVVGLNDHDVVTCNIYEKQNDVNGAD